MHCVTKIPQFLYVTASDLKVGAFPLCFDTVLKVSFFRGCPVRKAYLVCCSSDKLALVEMISRTPNVSSVMISSVEDLDCIL